MPLIQRYRKYEEAKKKMEALKNIRYLFESFAENEVKDEQILKGLKAIKEKIKISKISSNGINSLRLDTVLALLLSNCIFEGKFLNRKKHFRQLKNQV